MCDPATPVGMRVQFSVKQLLAVTAYLACAMGTAQLFESPVVLCHFLVGLVGWLTWRLLPGCLVGVIVLMSGVDILCCCTISWAYYGIPDYFGYREWFAVLGSVLIIAGACVLFWRATHDRGQFKVYLSAGLASLFFVISWWAILPSVGKVSIQRRRAADSASNLLAMAEAVKEVERVCERLGRSPSESELQLLLNKPLPPLRESGCEVPIQYRRTGEHGYTLSACLQGILVYDSADAKKGWQPTNF